MITFDTSLTLVKTVLMCKIIIPFNYIANGFMTIPIPHPQHLSGNDLLLD